MPFPHQQSGQNHEWKEDIPCRWRVKRKLVKRAIDIAVDGDRQDNVDPAKNGAHLLVLLFLGDGPGHVARTGLIELCHNIFEVGRELIPGISRAAIGVVLVGTEARMLHAQVSPGTARSQRESNYSFRA